MKNLIYILNMLMILIFASCKDENAFMPGDDGLTCYSILVSAPNNATRATYSEVGDSIAVKWEKGDVIDVDGKQFVYKEDRENNAALFVLYAESMPDVSGKVVKFGETENGVQIQSKNNKCHEVLVGTVPAGYSFTSPTKAIPLLPAKLGNQDMSLLHIQTKSPAMFMGKSLLKIKGLATEYTIQLGENPELVFADKNEQLDIYVTVATGTIGSGKTLKFYFYAYDENAGDGKDPQTNGDEYHYYMKCNASIAMERDKVVKMPLPNRPTHTAIQLGLPSGTKWSTMNVGATKETETGNYYAWGEVETKSSYTDGNSVTVDKTYSDLKGSVLNKFQLAVEYDAATENWGNDWVMPTNAEAKELVNGCTWTPATKDGVSGYSVSRGDKSIFLPATGYMGNTGIANASYAYYWLSSLVNDNYIYLNKVASSLYFDESGKGVSSGGLRSHGRAIRPILASSRATQEYKWEFEDIEGTLSGVFSVDDNKKVKFSKGNLQYQASTNTWRFAENQYDIVGLEGNAKISENYAGWIDLFGWGTSGQQGTGIIAYQPWSTSMNNSYYYVGGVYNNSLSGKADWGYNAISNGGNVTGKWRTLSKDEWNYLICRTDNKIRKDASGKKLVTKATVNGHPGALLFPDGWTTPSDITIEMNYSLDFTKNTYSKEQFDYLEYVGVVFMPATGYREGTVVFQLGEYDELTSKYKRITGTYWTSTNSSDPTNKSRHDETGVYACNLCIKSDQKNGVFGDINYGEVGNYKRGGGNAVRLVHNAK